MAEKAIFWTTGATGDGATAYTQAEVIRWLRQTFIGADNEGILKDYLNEMATTGATSPVATNTGGAYINGFAYWNTASVDTAIATPSANTRIDRLVLRANWSAQTGRITRIAGTEGTGNPPAIVQTDGTTWDVPLCQVSITTGGAITLTDEREFIHPNIAVDGDMIDDDVVDSQHYAAGSIDLEHMSANSVDSPQYVDGSIDTVHLGNLQVTLAKLAADSVDDTKAGNRVPQFYRRQGGSATVWSTAGTTTRTPTAVRMQGGVREFDFTSDASITHTVTFPTAFSYTPLVFITVNEGTSRMVTKTLNAAAGQCDIMLASEDGGQITDTLYAHWLAIGPE